ncbi:MAG TPA: LysR family transcriptional regulator substrate-binding protein, partial [Stenomitos sp.]
EAAQGVLNQALRLKGELRGMVRLGTISEPVALRLGDFLSALVATHPGLEVQLQQGVSGTVLDDVRAGRLDAGYVLDDEPDDTLCWVKLADVSLHVVGPAVWGEAFRTATWREIVERSWVGTPPACSFHHITERLFQAQGLRPNTVAVADQERTLRSLVAAGVGATLLREDQATAAIEAGEAVRWPGAEHRTGLWFVYQRHRGGEPVLQTLTEFVRRTWASEQDDHLRPAGR